MRPNLITMLTHNDKTVSDAKNVFLSCTSVPIQYWGFKDVGLPEDQMTELVEIMKKHEKTTFLEVVSLSEKDCMRGAKIAVDCGVDYLMGTVYYDSVFQFLTDNGTSFFPFCGRVVGHPSILEGTTDEIVDDGRRLQEKGVTGIDILAYRHKSTGEEIAKKLVAALSIPVVVAGSIDTYARIDVMKQIAPWGFTIGSALFEKKFTPGGTFRDNLSAAYSHLMK